MVGPGARPLRLWLVDDTIEHHQVVGTTIHELGGVAFTGFTIAQEALDAYARLASEAPGDLPDVVLMDFYLGELRGDAVTRRLRALQPPGHPMTIVGYSSVPEGSRAIVEAGGDVILRKVRPEQGRSVPLARWLATRLAVRHG